MHPINEYIKIALIPEPEQIVMVEKEPLQPALVLANSPDIELPFKSGDEIMIVRGRQVELKGSLFIHKEHILLYR